MAGSVPQALTDAVKGVEDPSLFAPLSALGTLVSIDASEAEIDVTVLFPVAEHPGLATLEERIEKAVQAVDSRPVRVGIVPMNERDVESFAAHLKKINLNEGRARRVLAIASGKGGVGKSTVTVNLAVALARAGHSVGLLDADVYGFSVPRMLGVTADPVVFANTVLPPVANGVRCVSMGFFVPEERAVVWRGPMLHKALEQFVKDVHWGSPQYLLIDMPPGTGDVAMSVAQYLPGSELYVVTTPQPAASRVAQRAGALAHELKLPIRGVIENMSSFSAPDGSQMALFGSGGGGELAKSLGVDLLAEIPFDMEMRRGADVGVPIAVSQDGGATVAVFDDLARRVADLGPTRIYKRELRVT